MAEKETEAAKKKRLAKEEAARQALKTPKNVLAAMKQLNKEKGNHAIELEKKKAEDFVSTGLLALDLIMGGGYYGGQVFQFFGKSHVGKSSLLMSTAAWVTQVLGLPGKIYDHEVGLDMAYSIRLGVNHDMVLYERPDTGEWTYMDMVDLCNLLPNRHSGLPQAVLFIDSVNTMKPQKWVDDPTNKQPAIAASMHAKGWKQLLTLLGNKHVSVVAVNQVTSNAGNPYGSSEVVPGGNAWEFATTNLVRMGRDGQNIELPDGRVLQPVKFKTYKNRNFLPMQECKVYLELGEGWDVASDIQEFCKKAGYYYKVSKKTGKPAKGGELVAIRGLDPYVEGADGVWDSLEEFQAAVREQGRDGAVWKACRKALECGDAIERYRKSKNKSWSSPDHVDVDLLSLQKDQGTTVGDTEGADEEDFADADDSAPPAALGKGRSKKKAAKKTTKKKAVRKKKVTARS